MRQLIVSADTALRQHICRRPSRLEVGDLFIGFVQ